MKEVAQALYASKICSYAQGMNIIRAKSMTKDWGIEMGSLARIWKARRCMATHSRGLHTVLALPLSAEVQGQLNRMPANSIVRSCWWTWVASVCL